ncbi:MAG: hypothetical protein ACFFC7_29870 [Candidatus Hermodarchaeota archaeon]
MHKSQIISFWIVTILCILIIIPSIIILMNTSTEEVQGTDNLNLKDSNICNFELSKKIGKNQPARKIKDPTGKTSGYLLEDYSEDVFELMGSRGQTYRHFYNKDTGEYTYQSDILVQKNVNWVDAEEYPGWVTAEEYPSRFILRMRNGELHFFETASEITDFLTTLDHTSLWAVGFETFDGVMGFYLNFQDTVNGHGQYLYWPRLNDGKISAYDMPLYAIYPHIWANKDNIWYDQILTDQSIYSIATQNPRNTLEFYNTSTEFGIFFSLSEVVIQDTTWNFKHGFKYNMDDNLYHMITEFECIDQDFSNIGLTYEITTSPQSDDTPYRPAKFILTDSDQEVLMTVQDSWDAEQILPDFHSDVTIISENGESFGFAFDDMELAGFTKKHLKLHYQRLPDGNIHKMLCAGMYGFGEYKTGTNVEIDPSTSDRYSIDNNDLYRQFLTWKTTKTYMKVGEYSGNLDTIYIAFDTGINTVIADTAFVSLNLYCESSTFDIGSEGTGCRVYNIGNNADYRTAKENSLSRTFGTNTYQDLVYAGNIGSGAYRKADASKMESLTDYWANNRNDDEEWISFYFYAIGPETNDRYQFTDSQYSGTGRDPKLCFSYKTQDYSSWALIVAGSEGKWVIQEGDPPPPPILLEQRAFTYSALRMYQTLKFDYENFTDENIYLLTPYDTVRGENVPRDATMSEANFEWAINEISAFVNSGDQVLIFWTGHGNVDSLDVCDGWISAGEFDSNLDNIECSEMIIIIEACNASSLRDNLDDESNRVMYFSSKST